MGIIKREKRNGVTVFHLKKDMSDAEIAKKKATFCKRPKLIINYDADVYGEDGKLLLRFRKNVLDKKKIDACYDNVIKFAKNISKTRGTSSGNKGLHEKDKTKKVGVQTNILGAYDKWSIKNKHIFKVLGMKPPMPVRETRFNRLFPENWKKIRPLIQEIDKWYKKLTPEHYRKQKKKARETPYSIKGTAFTTVTTNLNYQTALHTDKGDDAEGFGNLVVIERGKYEGAETCFPQYDVGVDVRTGDVLFMDVHNWHCNYKMFNKSKDVQRLSLVSYLRYDVWKHSRGMSQGDKLKHERKIYAINAKYRKLHCKTKKKCLVDKKNKKRSKAVSKKRKKKKKRVKSRRRK